MSRIPQALLLSSIPLGESRLRHIKTVSHVQADFNGVRDNSILPLKRVKRISAIIFKNYSKPDLKKITSLSKFARKTIRTLVVGTQGPSLPRKAISQVVTYLPSLERLTVPLPFGRGLKKCKNLQGLSFKNSREAIVLSKLLSDIQLLSNLQRLELPVHSHDQGLQSLEEIHRSLKTTRCKVALTFVNGILREYKIKNQKVEEQEGLHNFANLAEAIFKQGSGKPFWLLSHPEFAANLRTLNFVATSGCNKLAFEKLNQFQNLNSLILKLNLQTEECHAFFQHCTFPASLKTLNLDFGDMILTNVVSLPSKGKPKVLGEFAKNVDSLVNLQNLKLTLSGGENDLGENIRFACLFLNKKSLTRVNLTLAKPEEVKVVSFIKTTPKLKKLIKDGPGLHEILEALSSSSATLKILTIDSQLLDVRSKGPLAPFNYLENLSINSPHASCSLEEFKLFSSLSSGSLNKLDINTIIETSGDQVPQVFGEVAKFEHLKDFNLSFSIDKTTGNEPEVIYETLITMKFLETFNISLKNYALGIKQLCDVKNTLQPQTWRWKNFVLAFKNRIIRMKTRGEVSVESLGVPKDGKQIGIGRNQNVSFQLVS